MGAGSGSVLSLSELRCCPTCFSLLTRWHQQAVLVNKPPVQIRCLSAPARHPGSTQAAWASLVCQRVLRVGNPPHSTTSQLQLQPALQAQAADAILEASRSPVLGAVGRSCPSSSELGPRRMTRRLERSQWRLRWISRW